MWSIRSNMGAESMRQATGSSRGLGHVFRPTFAHGPPVDLDDVGGEVVLTAQQRRATP